MQLDELVASVEKTGKELNTHKVYLAGLKSKLAEDQNGSIQVFAENLWTWVPTAKFVEIQEQVDADMQAKYDRLVKLRDDLQAALDEATGGNTNTDAPQPAPPASDEAAQ